MLFNTIDNNTVLKLDKTVYECLFKRNVMNYFKNILRFG